MNLSDQERQRYARQMILPQLGPAGQQKLKEARVLVVGAGGLGSPVLLYLAAAGVGTLGIIDSDSLELSNLHRQVIHSENGIGRPKADSAAERVRALNPDIKAIAYPERLRAANTPALFADYDIIVDGTDNFPARYLINDGCVLAGKPFVYGGILRFEGQCSVFNYRGGPCYRCIFPQPPAADQIPSCAEAGVLGVLPGIIGTIQANETIKMITGIGRSLSGRLLIVDGMESVFREVGIPKDSQCPACGQKPVIQELEDQPLFCPEQKAQPTADNGLREISARRLKEIMGKEPVYILDVREPVEWEIARIEGATLKPLRSLPNQYKDIPTNRPVYVICKAGIRSRKAIDWLKAKGYDNLWLVYDGMDAWSRDVDPSVPSY